MPQHGAAIQQQIERDFSEIESDLKASSCSIGIISSESLIGLEPENIGRLRDWLLTLADEVTAVCYVRRPAAYAASVIQEQVKWGGRLPLPASSLPIGRYKHELIHWEIAFGRENMMVRAASSENLICQDVVTDFAHQIGYSGALDRSTEYTNPGISRVAVLLLDALNALDNRLVSSNLAFQEVWKLPGEKYRLSSDLSRSVEVQSRQHVEYLREHWGIQFHEDATADAHGDSFDKATAEALAAFIAELHQQARSGEPSPFRERW